MLVLVKETCSDPIKRPLVEREIPAWRKLLAVPDIVETLNVIKEHRDQIAHVTERGMYTQARCSEFVRRIRESGWIIKFMQAVQPASLCQEWRWLRYQRFTALSKLTHSHGNLKLNPFVGNGWCDGVAHVRSRFQVHQPEIGQELQIGMDVFEVPADQFRQYGNRTRMTSPD